MSNFTTGVFCDRSYFRRTLTGKHRLEPVRARTLIRRGYSSIMRTQRRIINHGDASKFLFTSINISMGGISDLLGCFTDSDLQRSCVFASARTRCGRDPQRKNVSGDRLSTGPRDNELPRRRESLLLCTTSLYYVQLLCTTSQRSRTE